MDYYNNREFKALEFEEQAHVRQLVRQGKAAFTHIERKSSFGDISKITIVRIY